MNIYRFTRLVLSESNIVKDKSVTGVDDLFKHSSKDLPEKNHGNTEIEKTFMDRKTVNKKLRSIEHSPESMRAMMDIVSDLDKIDTTNEPDIHDTYYPEPQESDNLPAPISHEVRAASGVNPEWIKISDLPGYLSKPIRAMGRQIFSIFTDIPIEDIHLIANFMGQGPNEAREINAVAGYIRENGQEVKEASIQAEELLGGYVADVKIYRFGGSEYMLVRDIGGEYIYSWPTQEGHLLEAASKKRRKNFFAVSEHVLSSRSFRPTTFTLDDFGKEYKRYVGGYRFRDLSDREQQLVDAFSGIYDSLQVRKPKYIVLNHYFTRIMEQSEYILLLSFYLFGHREEFLNKLIQNVIDGFNSPRPFHGVSKIDCLYEYVRYVKKSRCEEFEGLLLHYSDPKTLYYYAKDILKSRWPEAEDRISEDPVALEMYEKAFNMRDEYSTSTDEILDYLKSKY